MTPRQTCGPNGSYIVDTRTIPRTPKKIADGSVDVVATRAVLAYVADKKAALGEFLRILKPGGRLSIAEPILQDDAFHARALRKRIEDPSQPVDRFLTLLHRWKAAQFPDTEETFAKSPIVNYSERDLLRCDFEDIPSGTYALAVVHDARLERF
ncbi:MAG: methyltransferase domain-containing protein [Steroidobacteraceae bacterium]